MELSIWSVCVVINTRTNVHSEERECILNDLYGAIMTNICRRVFEE